MQKDICYNVEKMHEPFPFTQDNQWDDSYFCRGENALPGSLIKLNPNRNLPNMHKSRNKWKKVIWNDSLKRNVFSITIYNGCISSWYIVFLPGVSKYLNYHDQRFNGELMRMVSGAFLCSQCMTDNTNQDNIGNWRNWILDEEGAFKINWFI